MWRMVNVKMEENDIFKKINYGTLRVSNPTSFVHFL
jgi:hypothetical protein